MTGFSQFTGAQMIADKYGFSREDLDAFALQSHQRASAAAGAGAFDREILPVAVEGVADLHTRDEGIRDDATLEAIAAVKPLQEGGTISAANASQICDGASGVLVVSGRALMVRADGRMVHDMYLAQVKTPQDSKEPWDQYRIVETLSGDEAFRSMAAGGCRLVC